MGKGNSKLSKQEKEKIKRRFEHNGRMITKDQDGSPSVDPLKYAEKWLKDYGFDGHLKTELCKALVSAVKEANRAKGDDCNEVQCALMWSQAAVNAEKR